MTWMILVDQRTIITCSLHRLQLQRENEQKKKKLSNIAFLPSFSLPIVHLENFN